MYRDVLMRPHIVLSTLRGRCVTRHARDHGVAVVVGDKITFQTKFQIRKDGGHNCAHVPAKHGRDNRFVVILILIINRGRKVPDPEIAMINHEAVKDAVVSLGVIGKAQAEGEIALRRWRRAQRRCCRRASR